MDGPRDYHTKQSKSERERQIPYAITYTWNLKYDINEHIYETKTDSQIQRTDLWMPRGRGEEGLGVWDQQMQTIIYRMDKQQCPTVQHRELYSISYNNHNRKEYEKEYVYITESLCCTAEIKHNIVN